MSRATLLLAWGVSLLPLLLETIEAEPILPGAARAGLVLLPWLALAGIPSIRYRAAPGRGRWDSALLPIALLLPVLGLALGLDARSGRATLVPALLAVAIVLVWSLSREAARRGGGTRRRVQAAAWIALVPGVVALHAALAWAPPGVAPARWAWTERCSPLAWGLRWTAAGADLADAPRTGGFVLGVALLGLALLALGPRAVEGEEGA